MPYILVRIGLIVVSCLGLLTPDSSSAATIFTRVGRTSGHLAVQDSAGRWRTIPAGGIAPNSAECRISADGPGHLLLSEAEGLFLGPMSRVKYDIETRRVTLLAGRLFCRTASDAQWTVSVGASDVRITAAGAEIVRNSDRAFRVTALNGTVQVVGPDKQPITVDSKTVRDWSDDRVSNEAVPISQAQEAELSSWTKPLPLGQGPGQLVIRDPQSESRTRLSIARFHSELVLAPPVALVKLDQAFYNPTIWQTEGEFIFNLPPGASVSRFAMFVTPTQLIEGEIIDRERADWVYSTIVRSKRDPAILEKIGDNLFRMRVFPIFPQEVKRILLDYTLPLNGRAGQHIVQLPTLSDLEPVWDFQIHGAIHGATPLETVSSPTHPEIAFKSDGRDQITFDFARKNYAPASDFMLAFQQSPPVGVNTYRQFFAPPLNLTPPDGRDAKNQFAMIDIGDTLRRGMDPWNEQAATYFLAELPNPEVTAEPPATDVLMLIETSSAIGSLDKVRPTVQTLLGGLRDSDRFRMLAVDISSRPVHAGWLKPGSPEALQASSKLEQEFCLGGVDLEAILETIPGEFEARPQLDGNDQKLRRRMVIYIGDGTNTQRSQQTDKSKPLIEQCLAKLTEAKAEFWAVSVLPDPRIETRNKISRTAGMGFFQVGRLQNGEVVETQAPSTTMNGLQLLQILADKQGGRCFNIAGNPKQQCQMFEWALDRLPSCLGIRDVKGHLIPVQHRDTPQTDANKLQPAVDLYVQSNILPGEPIRITGRLPESRTLQLQYTTQKSDGTVAKQTVELIPADVVDHLTGRYWAEQRLAHLNRIDAAVTDVQTISLIREAIVRLSREWSLLTPQTAFLVLETEQDYERWQIPRQARRPYWAAKGTPPILPLPKDWLAKNAPETVIKNKSKPGVTPWRQPEPHGDTTTSFSDDALIKLADKALAEGRHDSAARILAILRTRQSNVPQEVERIDRDLKRALQHERVLVDFGLRTNWFKPGNSTLEFPGGLGHFTVPLHKIPPYFRESHPLAEALLREVSFPGGEVPLDRFADWLERQLKVDVDLDQVHLEEESIGPGHIIKVPRFKNIAAGNALAMTLESTVFTYQENPNRLLLTTKTDGSTKKRIGFFPIGELVNSRPDFNLVKLTDPLEDRNSLVKRRIEQKLRTKSKFKLKEGTLQDVVNHLQEELEENIAIDHVKLEEESIATDASDITIDHQTVELGETLSSILRQKQLTYKVQHETLVITTISDSVGTKPMRIYPAFGLVYRLPDGGPKASPTVTEKVESLRKQRIDMWGNSFFSGGGFGGGFGGMGGGMGGGIGGGGGMGGIGGSAISQGQPQSNPATNGGEAGVSNPISPQLAPENPAISQVGETPRNDEIAPATDDSNADNRNADPLFSKQEPLLAEPPFRLSNTTESRRGSNVDQMLYSILTLTGGMEPGSPWRAIDGEGGDVQFHYPSLCFVVRQTHQTHEEITNLLTQLRDSQNRNTVHPLAVPFKASNSVTDDDRDSDVEWLIQNIQNVTGGLDAGAPWFEIDGEGGDVIYDVARSGLHVRQSPETLREIQTLLLNLKRERYALIHKSRPWEWNSSFGVPAMSMVPDSWKSASARLSESDVSLKPDEVAKQLELLKVRKEFSSGSWTTPESPEMQTSSFQIQRSETGRLRVLWPDHEIRVDGDEATLINFGMRFREIGRWGTGLREWLDVQIPCWPHRSNRELSEQFIITKVAPQVPQEQPDTTITLRFVPIALRDSPTAIDVTYNLTTGLPVEWATMHRGRIVTRLHFKSQPATWLGTPGESLSWTSITNDICSWNYPLNKIDSEIPAVTDPVPGLLTEDTRPLQNERLQRDPAESIPGFKELSQGQFTEAAAKFREVLKAFPDHPLILLFLARSLEEQQPRAAAETIQQAYADVVRIGNPDLNRFLMNHHPKGLSRADWYQLLKQQTEATRTFETELDLTERALQLGLSEDAIEHAKAAWNRKPPMGAMHLPGITLLIKTYLEANDRDQALVWFHLWNKSQEEKLSKETHQLLEMIELHGRSSLAPIYKRFIDRDDFRELPIESQTWLLEHYYRAIPRTGEQRYERWHGLLRVCELTPPQSKLARENMGQLLNELIIDREPNFERIQGLINQARNPIHKQQLREHLASIRPDPTLAVTEYWSLHQEGYPFNWTLRIALARMNQADASDKAVIIAESQIRAGRTLDKTERKQLAVAYDRLGQTNSSKRVRSIP